MSKASKSSHSSRLTLASQISGKTLVTETTPSTASHQTPLTPQQILHQSIMHEDNNYEEIIDTSDPRYEKRKLMTSLINFDDKNWKRIITAKREDEREVNLWNMIDIALQYNNNYFLKLCTEHFLSDKPYTIHDHKKRQANKTSILFKLFLKANQYKNFDFLTYFLGNPLVNKHLYLDEENNFDYQTADWYKNNIELINKNKEIFLHHLINNEQASLNIDLLLLFDNTVFKEISYKASTITHAFKDKKLTIDKAVQLWKLLDSSKIRERIASLLNELEVIIKNNVVIKKVAIDDTQTTTGQTNTSAKVILGPTPTAQTALSDNEKNITTAKVIPPSSHHSSEHIGHELTSQKIASTKRIHSSILNTEPSTSQPRVNVHPVKSPSHIPGSSHVNPRPTQINFIRQFSSADPHIIPRNISATTRGITRIDISHQEKNIQNNNSASKLAQMLLTTKEQTLEFTILFYTLTAMASQIKNISILYATYLETLQVAKKDTILNQKIRSDDKNISEPSLFSHKRHSKLEHTLITLKNLLFSTIDNQRDKLENNLLEKMISDELNRMKTAHRHKSKEINKIFSEYSKLISDKRLANKKIK